MSISHPTLEWPVCRLDRAPYPPPVHWAELCADCREWLVLLRTLRAARRMAA